MHQIKFAFSKTWTQTQETPKEIVVQISFLIGKMVFILAPDIRMGII